MSSVIFDMIKETTNRNRKASMKTIMGIRMYSISEVAKILGKSVYTIRQYIYTQKLGAVQIGREYWIPEKEIFVFLKRNATKRDIQL